MDINRIETTAEELAQKFNPDGLSPFPFDEIAIQNKDIVISQSNNLPNNISGAISFLVGEGDKPSVFVILVNSNKPQNRQYFTIAHELGHYFLHKEIIRSEEILVDPDNSFDNISTLFRMDDATSTKLEVEANRFAATLIMPKKLVAKAWNELKDVEECAKVFNVSVSAMSIRLEKLGFLI